MSRSPSLASERGAILVTTFMALLVLIGLAAFVVDYGVLWIGRHQAQNAADAGAIAGAIARAYDDFDDPPDAAGAAINSASQAASANFVWGAAAAVPQPTTPCPPEVGASGRCVRVDVYRDAAHNNALPTVFANLWTLVLPAVSQNVRATASARVLVSNATDCLRPWAIPDKWTGSSYLAGGPYAPPADLYTPPGPVDPGTGLRFPISNAGVSSSDLDTSIGPLTFDDLTIPAYRPRRTSVVPLALDLGYVSSRDACNRQIVRVGDQISISTAPPVAAAADLDGLPSSGLVSPRLVAVAVFDVEAFRIQKSAGWTGCVSGTPCVTVVNIVGFVVGAGGTSGVISSYPGVLPTDPLEPPSLSAASSFLKAVTLVR